MILSNTEAAADRDLAAAVSAVFRPAAVGGTKAGPRAAKGQSVAAFATTQMASTTRFRKKTRMPKWSKFVV